MSRRRARASAVSVYLGPRTFYKKDMERKERAGQEAKALPPRCFHCRRSMDVALIDGVPHCDNHRRACDGTCAVKDED